GFLALLLPILVQHSPPVEARMSAFRLRRRFGSPAATTTIRVGATPRWTSRQTTGQQGGASPVPGGTRRMTRFELPPKSTRAEGAPARQTGTRDPDALDCGCPVVRSSGLQSPFSVSRSFPSPERIRVFTVPRG